MVICATENDISGIGCGRYIVSEATDCLLGIGQLVVDAPDLDAGAAPKTATGLGSIVGGHILKESLQFLVILTGNHHCGSASGDHDLQVCHSQRITGSISDIGSRLGTDLQTVDIIHGYTDNTILEGCAKQRLGRVVGDLEAVFNRDSNVHNTVLGNFNVVLISSLVHV